VKSFILTFFLSLGILYAASTTTKIRKSEKNLSATSSAKKKTSRRLSKIATDIKSAEKDVIFLEKKIDKLEKNQLKTEEKYETLKSELVDFENDFMQTSLALDKKRKKFISLLSEQYSIVFAMEKAHAPTEESILLHEVYRVYKKQNSKNIAVLKSDISSLKKQKAKKKKLRNKTKKEIVSLVKERDSYAQKKKKQEKLLKKLALDEEKYNVKLEKIEDKQNSLRSTLAKLNILHTQEVEVARKRAAARKEAMRLEKIRQRKIRKAKALARAKARRAKIALRKAKTKAERKRARLAAKEAEVEKKKVYKISAKVRQINSSYTKSKTYKYRGGKTISPISGAKLIKKFGTYIDPIYKIKIFNESITLKAPRANTKVKNVLNGKVVFSGKSSMLGKVVVVAHSGKMHTVYAGLSKIAPTIHVGSKIKKGYVVGKVVEKLIFQATKNSKHINPLKLIKI
jgi:septal ring factor EnvC (AmiA/AmiB activator)